MAMIEMPSFTAAVRNSGGEADRTLQLVAAAFELLEEDGLEGLTIRAVLKRTGLARRAFYERFASKDDLVLAVFEHTLRDAAVFFEERAEELPDPLQRIEMIVVGLVVGGLTLEGQDIEIGDRRGAALSREHLRLAESRPQELQAALRPLLSLIAAQVSDGIRLGQFRPCEPDLQAALIFNLVATTLHTELLVKAETSDRDARKRLADDIWEFCRRAIVA
jgi:AcrR family transcriptional regulator